MAPQLRNVEDIFEDFSGRRIGIIRALTQDVDELFNLCDPDKESLCLLGLPNKSWQVTEPEEYVPVNTREPVNGINFVRDVMDRNKWLSMIAMHSDSWLISLAFFHGALLTPTGRKRLFELINNLPTVLETVTHSMPNKDSSSGSGSGSESGSESESGSGSGSESGSGSGSDTGSGSKSWGRRKSRGRTKRSSDEKVESKPKFADSPEEEYEDKMICGRCGGNDNRNDYWIGCATCDEWFHGKCVDMDHAKARKFKKNECESCSLDW